MKTTKYVLAIALGVAALVAARTYAGRGFLPSGGSLTYDSTTPKFTNFLVTWDGSTFDLTNAANSPFIFGSGCRCVTIVNGTVHDRETESWGRSLFVTIPEPSTIILLGTGLVGLVAAARRKRLA